MPYTTYTGYEISPCVEFTDEPPTTMAFNTFEEALEHHKEHAGSKLFWTLYGRTPNGGARAIGDFPNESDAHAILYGISGIRGTAGQRFYDLPTTVDITPVGMATPDGVKRVNATLRAFEDATAALANLATEFLEEYAEDITDTLSESFTGPHDVEQLKQAIVNRRTAQQDFLLAVAGRSAIDDYTTGRLTI